MITFVWDKLLNVRFYNDYDTASVAIYAAHY